MKKAVISTGSKQYIVAEGDTIEVELLKGLSGSTEFEALLVFDDAGTSVGNPVVSGSKVAATIIDADSQADKVTSIRYKAKKRVRTVRGHRQHYTTLKIASIQ